jgi:hypothetical protein
MAMHRTLPLVAAAATLLLAWSAAAAHRSTIELQGDVLQLELREAPVAEVVEAIARQAGFALAGSLMEEGAERVSLDYTGPVLKGLAQVLWGYNYVLVYAPAAGTAVTQDAAPDFQRVEKVYLLGPKEAPTDADLARPVEAGAPALPTTRTKKAYRTSPATAQEREASPTVRLNRLLKHRAMAVAPPAPGRESSRGVQTSPPTTRSPQAAGDAGARQGPAAHGASTHASDPRLSEQLRITTQRARENLNALVEGLEQVDGAVSQGR